MLGAKTHGLKHAISVLLFYDIKSKAIATCGFHMTLVPPQNSIELRLTGNGLSPGVVRSKDIAELIVAMENMVASVVVAKHPNLRKDQVVLGLSSIENGSIGLQFASSLEELTQSATKAIALSIQENNFYSLPDDSIKSLKTIADFTRSHDCNAEIYEMNGGRELLVTITPETGIIEYEPLRGETTIYGTVTRVGGANEEKPTIQFRTVESDRSIYCTTNRRTAKAAAKRLYQKIGLIGIAEWDAKTFELRAFDAKEISEYEGTSLPEAFAAISDTYGDAFDAIDDVASFAEEVRRGS